MYETRYDAEIPIALDTEYFFDMSVFFFFIILAFFRHISIKSSLI